MGRIGSTLAIRGLIGIAALVSFVLPAMTVQLDAIRGTVNVDVTLREAVTTMVNAGEWPAVILGALGTLIMSRAAIKFDGTNPERSRWFFTAGTALSLVFLWRLLQAHDEVFLRSGMGEIASPYLSLGLIVPLVCFLGMTAVAWSASLHAAPPPRPLPSGQRL